MEIGLAVGGAFLSSALNVIFDRLAPHGDWLKIFKTRKHDLRLLNKLRMTLLGIQAVLDDAENKQSSNRYVREWLSELQDVVEDAENLLEEINYEALKLKVEAQNQCSDETSQQQQVSGQFFDNIMPRVEETIVTLEDLENQIGRLGLLRNFGSSSKQETPKRQPTTSVVDDSDVYGRKNETEQLVSRLLLSVDKDGETPTVIPIIGLGGLGKTTLAKVVYNDPRLKGCFDLKAWVCVSEPYDAFKITKGLLQEIIGSSDSLANDTPNQIETKLKERIKGKKFLFILDDIWNDSYVDWVNLKSLFVQGKIGSKVIVTTRKENVAKTMGTDEPIHLMTLLSEESWSLFERHAFKNKELREHPDYQEVGKRIAKKCKGLPLALKAIAGLLRQKMDIKEWRSVLTSEIWEQSINSDILPALQLSYNDLPQHLKRCFAYCALFPKDYPFDRERVVHLWIANGLVQQHRDYKTIQDRGNQCFLELQSRSLIEKEAEKFMMHDLVNDLAQVVSSKLCVWLEDLHGSHSLERARHLSYCMSYVENFKNFEFFNKLERLKTLLPINFYSRYILELNKRVLHNIFPKLTSLKALSLSGYRISELPDSFFFKLNQLRFLDLSYTLLRKLPTSTCVLYSLQTLLLAQCKYLVMLPPKIENLISLCYLDIRGTPISNLQLEASKSIQVLLGDRFSIGGCDGTGIVGDLNNLPESSTFLELQNVDDGNEAMKAKLMYKEHIEELSLRWSHREANDSQTEWDILDKLQPSTKIKEITVHGYLGTKFPGWVGDQSFSNLVTLYLEKCYNCYSLPALGQLPSLKYLTIERMHGISQVTEEFYGNDQSSMEPFQSLVELKFRDMPELKEWHVLGFPKLQRLSVSLCPKMVELSQGGLAAPNLKELQLKKCSMLKSLPERMRDLLPSLDTLDISCCPEIESFPQGGLPFTLDILHIQNCKKLVNNLKEWHLQELPSLRVLCICYKLKRKVLVFSLIKC